MSRACLFSKYYNFLQDVRVLTFAEQNFYTFKLMPTTFTELEDTERGKIILRIEGSLMQEDAVLLEKIALDLREQRDRNITLDLADLDFLDSDSAPILKRMEREHGFEIEGIEFFLQTIVNEAEKNNN